MNSSFWNNGSFYGGSVWFCGAGNSARSRLSAGSGRLKGGCGQDWPPSKTKSSRIELPRPIGSIRSARTAGNWPPSLQKRARAALSRYAGSIGVSASNRSSRTIFLFPRPGGRVLRTTQNRDAAICGVSARNSAICSGRVRARQRIARARRPSRLNHPKPSPASDR